jgi:hypothetical protein
LTPRQLTITHRFRRQQKLPRGNCISLFRAGVNSIPARLFHFAPGRRPDQQQTSISP